MSADYLNMFSSYTTGLNLTFWPFCQCFLLILPSSLTLPLLPFTFSPLSFLFFCLSSFLLLLFSPPLPYFPHPFPPTLWRVGDSFIQPGINSFQHYNSPGVLFSLLLLIPPIFHFREFFHLIWSTNHSTSSLLVSCAFCAIPSQTSRWTLVLTPVYITIKPITVFKLMCSGG